jgi:hypothetical protein
MPLKWSKCLIALHLLVTSSAGPGAVEMMTIPVIRKREKDKKRPSFSDSL